MSIDKHDQIDINDDDSAIAFIHSIKTQERELVLTSGSSVVGAILTEDQYKWFLDQLDSHIDVNSIVERENDLGGSQSLDDFKKEMGE